MSITLTKEAAEHVRQSLIRRRKGLGLRLSVRTAGCAQYEYKLEYADQLGPGDQVFECHGVKVVVNQKSLPYIKGTELDFVSEKLKSGFKFNNPNVKEACGCGESFSV